MLALTTLQKVLISIPLDIAAFAAGLWLFRKVMNLLATLRSSTSLRSTSKGKKAKK